MGSPPPLIKKIPTSLGRGKLISHHTDLSHDLEAFDRPYGRQRPLITRFRVHLGLYPGGAGKSFQHLYQQRLGNILASCPRSFRDAAGQPTATRIDLEAYARNRPLSKLDEPSIRRAVDAYCFHFWVADELVRRAALSPPGGYHVAVGELGTAGCELWIESTAAEAEPPDAYLASVVTFRAIVKRLEGSLACFEMDEVPGGLTKPLHYLAMCMWGRFNDRLREVLLRQVEGENLEMYAEVIPLRPGQQMRQHQARADRL